MRRSRDALSNPFLAMSFDSADFSEVPAGQTALMLMQPTFIRVMDHLRRTLEQSAWQGQYETTHAWPEGTTPEVKAEVLWLYDKLEGAAKVDQADIECQLEELPQPVPVYLLHLEKEQQKRTINVWELCYQICLEDYTPEIESKGFVEVPLEEARPDRCLFDASGEVDWVRLDQKTAGVIQAAFQSLENSHIG
jgi:hypothetical protein